MERWQRSETWLVWVCFCSLRAFEWGFPVIVERQSFEGCGRRCKHARRLSLSLWSRLGLGLRMTGCMVSVYYMVFLSVFLFPFPSLHLFTHFFRVSHRTSVPDAAAPIHSHTATTHIPKQGQRHRCLLNAFPLCSFTCVCLFFISWLKTRPRIFPINFVLQFVLMRRPAPSLGASLITQIHHLDLVHTSVQKCV